MDLGEPIREVEITPDEAPVPERTPLETPVEAPEEIPA